MQEHQSELKGKLDKCYNTLEGITELFDPKYINKLKEETNEKFNKMGKYRNREPKNKKKF